MELKWRHPNCWWNWYTFLGMSHKKWRLSLRNCGLTVCFDPHFFSAQLNGDWWLEHLIWCLSMISFEQIYVKNLQFVENVINKCWRRTFKLSNNVSHSSRVICSAILPPGSVVHKSTLWPSNVFGFFFKSSFLFHRK